VLSLLLTLSLAGTPTPREVMLGIDRQETLNLELEAHFDAICAALKSGRHDLSGLVAPEVRFPIDDFVQVPSCSLRALSVGKVVDGAVTLRVLWDLDGRDAAGHRRSVRAESDGQAVREGKGWKLTRLDTSNAHRVERDAPRFVERSAEVGLVLPELVTPVSPAAFLSSGLAVRDVDGDGIPDVFVIDRQTLYLFRGKPGLHFAPPVVVARTQGDAILSGVSLGDLDGDGDPDLVLTTWRDRPVRLFRNDHGTFVEAGKVGRGGQHQGTVLSDLDGDGTLDLAVVSYPLGYAIPSSFLNADNGDPPELWLGNGDFTFRRLPLPESVARHHWSFGGVAADLLHQGGMQLYVFNDYGVKDLYVVGRDGGVSEVSAQYGLNDPGGGMSVDLGDVDNDDRVDIYIANMFSKAGTRIANGVEGEVTAGTHALVSKFVRGNTLFLGQPDGGYADHAVDLEVHRGLWSFASLLADVDNDSRLEVLVANGFISGKKRKDL
jgi:hypothetical protein